MDCGDETLQGSPLRHLPACVDRAVHTRGQSSRRRGARSLHGQRHNRDGGAAARTQVSRVRVARKLPRHANSANWQAASRRSVWTAIVKLRPYQDEGATWIYERDRSLILAPVGAGKTAIALTAISEMLRDKVCTRVLVLAPKRVAQHVWPAECAIWTPHLRIAVAVGTPAERLAAFKSNAQIVVTNYDNIQTIPVMNFDCVVFDELTRLKNPSGKRFKALAPEI